MIKQILLTILAASQLTLVKGQDIGRREADSLLQSIKINRKDIVQLNRLLKLAEFNIFKQGEVKADLDSAENFLNQAHQLNVTLKSPEANGYIKLVDAYFSDEKGKGSKQLYIQAEVALQTTKDLYHLSLAKVEVARYYNANIAAEAVTKMELLNSAAAILRKAGNDPLVVRESLIVRKEIADVHYQQGKFALAINELNDLLADYKKTGAPRIFMVYDLLGVAYWSQGNNVKAIYNSLESVKSIRTAQDSAYICSYYYRLAYIYIRLNKDAEAREWFEKALNYYMAKNDRGRIYHMLPLFADRYNNEKRPGDGLKFIDSIKQKLPPKNNEQEKLLAGALAKTYEAFNQVPLAEKYYRKMIRYSDLQVTKGELAGDPLANSRIATFYLKYEKGGYKKTRMYLKKTLDTWTSDQKTKYLFELQMNFKLDSATGNYISAIKQLQRKQSYNDSTFTEMKSKQIEELGIAYDTEQKKRDIKILEGLQKLQAAKLQYAEETRTWIIAAAATLLILVVIIYNRYRLKQKSNKLLQAQREEITRSNKNLQITVVEKDELLLQKEHLIKEKEWLLKEVHHRVKNNLHTVICLLESQAVYLENDALKAIESSQHRIYAMSLIHQKLYQSDDIKTIDMSVYLPEFIQYLNDSFGVQRQVRFHLEIEPLQLGVSQAIPLALIVNEAVTNSIKYAFKPGVIGIISISMSQQGKEIKLIVCDNGVGIDPALADKPMESLGLKLMNGLSEDINARITFENDKGTKITVIFNVDPLSPEHNLSGAFGAYKNDGNKL